MREATGRPHRWIYVASSKGSIWQQTTPWHDTRFPTVEAEALVTNGQAVDDDERLAFLFPSSSSVIPLLKVRISTHFFISLAPSFCINDFAPKH